jgi:hypothetical protein
MPSVSKKQHNLMAAVAKNPAFAKKVGIKQSVGQDFLEADKGKKFKEGGMMDKKDLMQDKMLIKKAFKQHDAQEHKGGKGTSLKLKKGGVAKTVTKEMEYDYKTGKKSFAGSTAKRDAHAEKEGKIVAKHLAYDKAMGMKEGGRIAAKGEHPIQKQSTRGAKIMTMCGGGMSKAKKYARGGGIEVRGKTKGKMC